MTRRILVPVDGSDQSREAFEFALTEFSDAELVLLHVINPAEASYGGSGTAVPSFPEEWYDRASDSAERLLDELVAAADERGVETSTETMVGSPSSVVVEYADENDVDQIVMGSHGRSGVQRILLGSVAEKVVRRASVPVTVAR